MHTHNTILSYQVLLYLKVDENSSKFKYVKTIISFNTNFDIIRTQFTTIKKKLLIIMINYDIVPQSGLLLM